VAIKPQLSREYLYVPFDQMEGLDVDDLVVSRLAFMDAGVEPAELDWIDAIIVGSLDPLYVPAIGEAIALLVGPDRGDSVTTEDLAIGDYQVWVDAAVTGSDERIVRVAGLLEITATGA
jgi:hypothetical protein